MSELSTSFEAKFFFDEVNRFVGSGGELLVKGDQRSSYKSRIEVGDRLIGIGIAHTVEGLERTPGPAAFHSLGGGSDAGPSKMAARAFQVERKEQKGANYEFHFKPLSPSEYSGLLEQVSGGSVRVPPASIPKGTMVISYLKRQPKYTLELSAGSPGTNWHAVAEGESHWCVGIGKQSDYWESTFPSDDISIISQVPAWTKIGQINFGLSLLPGSNSPLKLGPVSATRLSGDSSTHDFCLSGTVVGTAGLKTPFPIGLRTEIVFKPIRN